MTENQAKVLEKAIADWADLTGRPLMGEKQGMLTFVAVVEIKESFALDVSGITALLILNAETEHYADQVSYSIKDMVDNQAEVMQRIQAFSSIRAALKHPEFAEILANFKTSLKSALDQYGLYTPEVEKVLLDPVALAYIRRDALRAYAQLREDIFSKGAPTTDKFKYNPGMFLFWNINSLLRLIGNSQSGVTLCLVQDNVEANASHFAFAVKNGANLIVLSDKPKFDNPDQAGYQSARGGSRELARRMELFRFPYKLAGAWVDRKGRGYLNMPGSNTLVPAQVEAIKLADLQELPADSIIWLVLMLELIQDKCWANLGERQSRDLSYSGAMIEHPASLTEGCQALTIQDYKPLQFKPVTLYDALTDQVQFEVKQTRQNEWMEQLYKDQVPVELLNPLPSTTPLIPAHLQPTREDQMNVWGSGQPKQLVPLKLREDSWGTEKELAHNHMYVARKNFATVIERLTIQDFKAKVEEVSAWYREKLLANKEFWLRGLAAGELRLPYDDGGHGEGFRIRERPLKKPAKNALAFYPPKDTYSWTRGMKAQGFHNGYCREQDAYYCFLSPQNIGREKAVIEPTTPEALALLCGCKVSEMPIYLQNWYRYELYHGNSILDDVDPLEDIANPWQSFHADLVIRFGRKGLYKLQASFALPKKIHWSDKPDET